MGCMDDAPQPRHRSHLRRLFALTLLGVILGYAFSPGPDPEDRWQQYQLPMIILYYTITGALLGVAAECSIRAKELGVRFSLGTMLIAMTLIAVVLGLLIFVSRN
jgi:hypothetical protein